MAFEMQCIDFAIYEESKIDVGITDGFKGQLLGGGGL